MAQTVDDRQHRRYASVSSCDLSPALAERASMPRQGSNGAQHSDGNDSRTKPTASSDVRSETRPRSFVRRRALLNLVMTDGPFSIQVLGKLSAGAGRVRL